MGHTGISLNFKRSIPDIERQGDLIFFIQVIEYQGFSFVTIHHNVIFLYHILLLRCFTHVVVVRLGFQLPFIPFTAINWQPFTSNAVTRPVN